MSDQTEYQASPERMGRLYADPVFQAIGERPNGEWRQEQLLTMLSRLPATAVFHSEREIVEAIEQACVDEDVKDLSAAELLAMLKALSNEGE